MKNLRRIQGVALTSLIYLASVFACSSSKDGDDDGAGAGPGNSDGDISLGGDQGGPGGDGDRGGNGDSSCGGEDVEANPLAANVLLVVDISGSMTQTPDSFAKNKWETLKDAFSASLPEVGSFLSMGLKVFPSAGADSCGVAPGVEIPIGLGTAKVNQILAQLDDTTPAGATPTEQALSEALAYFSEGAGKDLEGDKYVLLATDGGPNCSETPAVDCTCDENPNGNTSCGEREQCTVNLDGLGPCTVDGSYGSCCLDLTECLNDTGTLDAVEALANAGIKTIVLGMPGSEAYASVLDQLAVAGGLPASSTSPRYNRVDNAEELEETLRSVTRDVIRSCEIQLEMTPPNLSQVNVYLDGAIIFKDDNNGWKYDPTTTPPGIVFTGPTCERVESEGVGKVSVKYGCQTIIR